MDNWIILVGAGYGAFLFQGTEQEAEDMRSHKARWERGIGKKRPATEEEVSTGKPSQCWNHPGFGNKVVYNYCDCDDEDCVVNSLERMKKPKRARTARAEQPQGAGRGGAMDL